MTDSGVIGVTNSQMNMSSSMSGSSPTIGSSSMNTNANSSGAVSASSSLVPGATTGSSSTIGDGSNGTDHHTSTTGGNGGNSSSNPSSSSAAASIENAAELKFGSEFEDIQILSNALVAVILQNSARSAVNRDEELHEVYRKTQKYVDRFNTMTNPEKNNQELVDELDNLQDALTTFRKETEEGEEMELHGSEVAALMNLVATDTTVDEAKALIPSLSRFPEAAIDEILDLIRTTMIRIVT